MHDLSSARIESDVIIVSSQKVNLFNSTIKTGSTIILGGTHDDLKTVLEHRYPLPKQENTPGGAGLSKTAEDANIEASNSMSSSSQMPQAADDFEMVTGDEATKIAKDLALIKQKGDTFDLSNAIIPGNMHLHYNDQGEITTLVFRKR